MHANILKAIFGWFVLVLFTAAEAHADLDTSIPKLLYVAHNKWHPVYQYVRESNNRVVARRVGMRSVIDASKSSNSCVKLLRCGSFICSVFQH